MEFLAFLAFLLKQDVAVNGIRMWGPECSINTQRGDERENWVDASWSTGVECAQPPGPWDHRHVPSGRFPLRQGRSHVAHWFLGTGSCLCRWMQQNHWKLPELT